VKISFCPRNDILPEESASRETSNKLQCVRWLDKYVGYIQYQSLIPYNNSMTLAVNQGNINTAWTCHYANETLWNSKLLLDYIVCLWSRSYVTIGSLLDDCETVPLARYVMLYASYPCRQLYTNIKYADRHKVASMSKHVVKTWIHCNILHLCSICPC
jgi:hypothetical protein